MQTEVLTRNAFAPYVVAVLLSACQLPSERPPEAPPSKVVLAPSEPAALPPEETPPEEPAAPAVAPEPKPVEPGLTPTGTPTRGTLPKGVIGEKLKAVGPALQSCYERGLKTKPELRGTLSIDFVVAPDGKVAHASVGESDDTLSDAATVACIFAEIRKLEFPPPQGGRVFINYPLRLEPQKP